MKRSKLIIISMFMLLMCTSTALATEIWASGGGNWTTASSWQYWDGSSWATAWVPTASDHVVLWNTSTSTPISLASGDSAYIDHLYMGGKQVAGDTDQLNIYGTLDLNNTGGNEVNGIRYGSWFTGYDIDTTINVYSGGWFDAGYIQVLNDDASSVNKIVNQGGTIAWVKSIALGTSKIEFELNGGQTYTTMSSVSGATSSKLTWTLKNDALLVMDTNLLTSMINAGCIIADTTTVTSANRSTLLDEDTTYYPWIYFTLAGGSAPSAASSPSPANTATDVSIAADLSWTAGNGADSHDVYFGTTSPGTYQGNQAGTTFDPGTLANDTTYYWRIDEVNSYGTTTGTVWSFTTVVTAPGIASSPSPSDNATNVAIDADLSWTAGNGATSHDVYFGTTSPGTFQSNQAGTTFDPGTLANDTTYYWRIDEVNAGGTTTGTVWSFTTIVAAPSGASNPSPANSATDVAVDADLSWTVGSGATSHDVYFGTSSPGAFQGNQAGTTFDPGTLANDTTYYWRIDEVNTGGTTTGTVWNFTTIVVAPSVASNPSPADAATNVAIDADLSWTAGSGATSHDVYFGTSSPGAFQGNQVGTTFDPGTLSNDTTYYWRIDEVNAGGTTTGTVWSFTTEIAIPLPGLATNPSPASVATDVAVDADLSWTAGSGATSHDVYFGTSSPGAFQGNQAGTTFDPGTMADNTTYYWRIDEVNTGGTTTGTVWSFTTIVVAPGTASSPSPGDSATDVDVDADLSWTAGSGATSHDIYFGITSPGTFQGNQAGTTFDPGTLSNDTTYYWRIDEVNTAGTTTGTIWSFTTESELPLSISNISPSGYSVQYDNLAVGATVYIDRSYTFTNVASLGGSTYIETANADKYSTGTSFLTFDVNQNSTVYVAHDDNITTKPSWLSTFTDTGENLVTTDNGKSFSLYSKDFTVGTVTLGGNGGGVSSSMYSVVVVGNGLQNEAATNPSPVDGATGVSVDIDLSWTAGYGATSHDVYFGTSSPGTYQGNQAGTTFDPGILNNSTTYYWRIDEINAGGTTTGIVWSFTTQSSGGMSYLDNGSVKIGVDSSRGATITYFSESGSSRNVINYADWGREVQQSYYSGPVPFSGGSYNSQDWPWNPVEAGDTNNNNSTVVSLSNDGTTIYTKVIPKQWALDDVDSECTMEKWITLNGNVAEVTCKLVSYRTDTTDQYVGRHQELPAVYATADLYNIYTYNGSSPFTNAGITQMSSSFPWSYTDATENWIACVDNTNWGLGIFTPNAQQAVLGFYGTYDTTPPGDPTDASTAYMAPLRTEIIDYNITYEYDFYLILDTLTNIRSYAYANQPSQLPDYVFDDSRKGWYYKDGLVDSGFPISGYLHVLTTSSDPYMIGPETVWQSGNVPKIYVRARHNTTDTSAKIYWESFSSLGWSEDRSKSFTIIADDQWHTYEVDLSSDLDYTGTIRKLRLDPVGNGGAGEYVDVASITSYNPGGTLPGSASSPSPADTATDVSVDSDLSWTAGIDATSHDVYFGTSSPGAYQGNQAGTTFDPGTLANDTTYYWRIDEVNGAGTTTGTVWSFTTIVAAPSAATNPSPVDTATNVATDVDVSWSAGSGATSHDVYFGTSSPGTYQGNQAGTTFDPGTLANDTTYYWHIDEVNAGGTTTGTVWSFTTVVGGTAPGSASSPSPADTATDIAVDADLSWTAGSGATSHDVYFGTSSPGTYQGNQAGTTFDPGTLTNGTTYYWRIDEVNTYGTTTGTIWSFTTLSDVALTITNMNKTSYTVEYDSLYTGELMYIDRSYTFATIPASVQGSTYIMTANDDKYATGVSFLTFDVNKDCTVYVAHVDVISTKPSWMSTFTDTGENITGSNPGAYSLYAKNFAAGTVTLGGNGGDESSSMYCVIVVPISSTAPGAATNPSPIDGVTNVSTGTNLNWTTGSGATSHDVYFGTSSPGTYQGNQTNATFDPGTLLSDTTYYWRIDEVNAYGTTTGTVWSFTTQSGGTIETVFPGYAVNWATKTPAELGLNSTKLDQLASNIGGNGIIVRQGYVVKTWGSQSSKADWASACKPVISTMLFYAVEENLLTDVHELIGDHGWSMITKDQTMEFYHLANMISGYARGEVPGAAWAYNDYAINLYAKTLFDNVYGTTANTAATNINRLGALGFQDGSIFGSRGGYGIETSVRDFARIGWLWCNKGYWDGSQLLPKQYFDDYMKAHVSSSTPRTTISGSDYLGVGTLGGGSDQTANGPGVYGFNWWCNDNVVNWPDAPADTIQANGHWGLEVVTVIPSLSVVVATYGGNMGDHNTGSSTSTMNQNLKLLTEACPPPVSTDGFIQVDPTNSARMVYSGTSDPVCFAGPGDPEDFFYNDTANNLSLLTSRGARCTYITAVLQDFGGGNPGTGTALDAKLDEWEGYITQLEEAGVITVFFFFDDSQGLTSNWQELVDDCVAKFKHHKLLIWSVAEEYGEALSTAEVSAVAARIKSQDDKNHIVGVHQNDGNTFDFLSDSNIDMFLMQRNLSSASDLHNAVKNSNANGSKIVNLAEVADHASKTQTTVRQWNWAAIMGGASAVQVLYMGRASDPADYNTQGKYDDCARLMDFMESTNLNVTSTRDDLARGETDYVLADPGNVYIVYGDAVTTSLGVNIVASDYKVKWFDPIDGDWVDNGVQPVSSGDQYFSKPGTIGSEAVLYLEYDPTGGTVPGAASSPSPADAATDVVIDTDLSWTAGSGTTSHDVYFGTSSPGAFQGNQAGTTFDPGTLANDTTYYWRIDEVNAYGTTTGTVWSFTTEVSGSAPGTASSPSPSDAATDVSVDADLSWAAGTDATSHDVYFGTSSPGSYQGNQTGTTFDPGTLANDTTYYWRIDEVNAYGTTTGTVWSFTTIAGSGTTTLYPNDDCTVRNGVNYDAVDPFGLLVKASTDVSYIEFTTGSTTATSATLKIYNDDASVTAYWDIVVKGAQYNFDETSFTGTNTSAWSTVGTIQDVMAVNFYTLDITTFYNNNLNQTVTLYLTRNTQPSGSGPIFEDREGTKTGNGTTYGPQIEVVTAP